MEDSQTKNLIDYKFFCFNGEIKFLYVSQGLENHSTARISFLTTDWNFAEFRRSDYKGFETLPQKPSCFEQMKYISTLLSKDVPFLRVDLYEINGQIYFSELTFSPCSGYVPFYPEKYDLLIGAYLKLPQK